MVEIRMKTRATGASAALGVRGHAAVTSVTGGRLEVVTGVNDPGFNPLDLLYASLAACLVLSVKGAVIKMQLLEQFEGCTAEVTGDKAHDEPSRVETLHVAIKIGGHFSDAERQAIVKLAKQLCTVSNTLALTPHLEINASRL
jgi:uncharacterized OsmC-like protein